MPEPATAEDHFAEGADPNIDPAEAARALARSRAHRKKFLALVWAAALQRGFPNIVRKELETHAGMLFDTAWSCGARGNDHPALSESALDEIQDRYPEVADGAAERIAALREFEFVELVLKSVIADDREYASATDQWNRLNRIALEHEARQLWRSDPDVREKYPRRIDARRVVIDRMRRCRGRSVEGVDHELRKLYLRHAIGREADGRG